MVDVVYCVGPRPPVPDVLRWSIRSLWHHLPFDRLYVAGVVPKWLGAEALPVDQDGPQWVNMGRNLKATLESDIAESFYWCNDDFFVTQNIAEVPLLARDTLFDDYLASRDPNAGLEHRRGFLAGMAAQRDILRAWGYDNSPCLDLHVPMPLEKARLKDLVGRIETDYPDHELGHFRALYLAVTDIEPVLIRDCKVSKSSGTFPPEWTYVSTGPAAWRTGSVGVQLRNRYWRPSPWEID
jgi:hypothetical protein